VEEGVKVALDLLGVRNGRFQFAIDCKTRIVVVAGPMEDVKAKSWSMSPVLEDEKLALNFVGILLIWEGNNEEELRDCGERAEQQAHESFDKTATRSFVGKQIVDSFLVQLQAQLESRKGAT